METPAVQKLLLSWKASPQTQPLQADVNQFPKCVLQMLLIPMCSQAVVAGPADSQVGVETTSRFHWHLLCQDESQRVVCMIPQLTIVAKASLQGSVTPGLKGSFKWNSDLDHIS
jgi:hypothetical protein